MSKKQESLSLTYNQPKGTINSTRSANPSLDPHLINAQRHQIIQM